MSKCFIIFPNLFKKNNNNNITYSNNIFTEYFKYILQITEYFVNIIKVKDSLTCFPSKAQSTTP